MINNFQSDPTIKAGMHGWSGHMNTQADASK